MAQSPSVMVRFEGEVARALAWEASRRNLEVEDLVLRLVRNSSWQILCDFRRIHREVAFLDDRRPRRDPARFRDVVRKALGPSGS